MWRVFLMEQLLWTKDFMIYIGFLLKVSLARVGTVKIVTGKFIKNIIDINPLKHPYFIKFDFQVIVKVIRIIKLFKFSKNFVNKHF